MNKERFSYFWIPEPNSGCWLWLGSDDGKDRYGKARLNGRQMNAHRLAWIIFFGMLSPKDCVLHKCDTPPCVNPYHLYVGTQKHNARDREERKRGNHAFGARHYSSTMPERLARGDRNGARSRPETLARGEDNHKAVLTESQVVQARSVYAAGGITFSELAKQFGMSKSSLRYAVIGMTWRHVPGAVVPPSGAAKPADRCGKNTHKTSRAKPRGPAA